MSVLSAGRRDNVRTSAATGDHGRARPHVLVFEDLRYTIAHPCLPRWRNPDWAGRRIHKMATDRHCVGYRATAVEDAAPAQKPQFGRVSSGQPVDT